MGADDRVIVIGSGPSGAMASRQLIRRGIPVTMLESGSSLPHGLLLRLLDRNLARRAPPPESITVGETHEGAPRTLWIRHLAPGGLSNQWTGAIPRFSPEDFFEGERLHERFRWPIRYADLEPYYADAERLMQLSGQAGDAPNLPAGSVVHHRRLPDDWLPLAAAAALNGQALTPLPIADGSPNMLVARGTAFNSYSVIVKPLLHSDRFELLVGAHALELEWSSALGRVSSVVYYDRNDRQEKRLSAAAVVVACGPLHSTKLLLNSLSADFPDGIGNSRGLLGRNLHDHVRDWWTCDLDRPITLLSSAAYLTRRPFASSPPLEATSWTLGVADMKDKVRSRAGLRSRAVGVQVFGTTTTDERNNVRRSATQRDEFGRPDLDVHMQFDAAAVRNVFGARATLVDLFSSCGYGGTVRPAPNVLTPGESVHFGGTIRMHESPTYGVADATNRLYDAPNVLTCDAACFTTGSEKNPTLTAMAIAARAADRLADDLLRRAPLTAMARR